MTESYKGTKFKTIFLDKREIFDKKIHELIKYCKEFAKKGFSPKYHGGSSGNLSYMTPNGIIITGANTDLETITPKDLVLVQDVNYGTKEVKVIGLKEPSSETLLHSKMYELRHQVNAVFHGHDELVLKYNNKLKLPITKDEKAYGILELVEEVEKILKNNDYVLMKNHGFIALGAKMEDASKETMKQHNKALKISKLA